MSGDEISERGKFIKKLMGWCPDCNRKKTQAEQPYEFSNSAFLAGKTKKSPGNNPEFRISNVVFPTNSSICILLYSISLQIFLENQDLSGVLINLIVIDLFCYSLWLKALNAAIVADESGIQLQAFRFRNFEIPYDEIEAVASYKLEKHSKKTSVFLFIMGVVFCGFVLYVAARENDWTGVRNGLLILISMLPLLFFAEKKTRAWKSNTRLDIMAKHKKWYEFTPYYSLVTDETRASELKSFIAAMQVKAE